MKIALLTRNPKLFSHQRLIEAAKERGHEIVPIDYLRCYMNITSQKPELALSRRRAHRLRCGDPAHRRLAYLLRPRGAAAVRDDGRLSARTNRWRSGARATSCDRLQILARDGVGLPVTAFANDTTRTNDVLDIVGGAPVVIKLLEGTQGIGVVLGETPQIGQVGDRCLSRRQYRDPGAAIHQGDGGQRHPRLRGRRQGGGHHGAARRRRASSAPTCIAAGRHGRSRSRPDERRTATQGGPLHGAQCGRRRHAALAIGAGGDGGQFLAGA